MEQGSGWQAHTFSILVAISDQELFSNIQEVWIRLGRQPRKRDMAASSSRYSERPYARRFGSWRRALEAFVQWAGRGR
jgi:hypothetical protein